MPGQDRVSASRAAAERKELSSSVQEERWRVAAHAARHRFDWLLKSAAFCRERLSRALHEITIAAWNHLQDVDLCNSGDKCVSSCLTDNLWLLLPLVRSITQLLRQRCIFIMQHLESNKEEARSQLMLRYGSSTGPLCCVFIGVCWCVGLSWCAIPS